MASYGVLDEGFVIKPQEIIEDEIEATLKSTLGAYINTLPTALLGQLKFIFAEREFSTWQLAQGVYNSGYLNTASGQSLDFLGALVGAERLLATASTVVLKVDLDATTTLTAGAQAKIPSTDIIFQTDVDVTSTTAGDYTVAATATVTGPLVAGISTVTEIVTPQSGWNTVTNDAIAVVGRDVETDEDFRARIVILLRAQGEATRAAIRGDLLDVDGVTEVIINQNVSFVTDADGLPPKSFEAVVRGGVDLDVATEIEDSGAAGIETYGTTTVNVTDEQGITHAISFTRPTEIPIFMEVDFTTDSNWAGASAETAVKTALAAAIATFEIGDDVFASQLYDEVFSVAGVVDITSFDVDTSAPASGSTVPITTRQIATSDTGDIVLNVT